jgi:hypothetical protein
VSLLCAFGVGTIIGVSVLSFLGELTFVEIQ